MHSSNILIALVAVLCIVDMVPAAPFVISDHKKFTMRQDGGWAPPSASFSPVSTARVEPVKNKKKRRKNTGGKEIRGPLPAALPTSEPLFEYVEMSAEPSMEPFPDTSPDQDKPDVNPSFSPLTPVVPDATISEVCVDIAHLSSQPRKDLVHSQHFFAPVFCPVASTLPCGTGDHLLIVSGSPMSYRDYCNTTLCVERVSLVNSVLSHIWNDEMHHGKVQLTMYDARHPTSMQKVLHRAIAAGRVVFGAIAPM